MQPLFRIFCSFVFFFFLCFSQLETSNGHDSCEFERMLKTRGFMSNSTMEHFGIYILGIIQRSHIKSVYMQKINRYAVWLWPGWLKNPKNIQLTAPRTAAIPLQFKHDSQHRRTQIAVISHHMMWCTKHRDVSQTPLSKHISYVVMLLYTKGIWLKSLSAAPESVPHPHFPASTKEQEQRIIDIRLLFHNDH